MYQPALHQLPVECLLSLPRVTVIPSSHLAKIYFPCPYGVGKGQEQDGTPAVDLRLAAPTGFKQPWAEDLTEITSGSPVSGTGTIMK